MHISKCKIYLQKPKRQLNIYVPMCIKTKVPFYENVTL